MAVLEELDGHEGGEDVHVGCVELEVDVGGAEVVTGGSVQVKVVAVNKLNPANDTGERFGVNPFNVE